MDWSGRYADPKSGNKAHKLHYKGGQNKKINTDEKLTQYFYV